MSISHSEDNLKLTGFTVLMRLVYSEKAPTYTLHLERKGRLQNKNSVEHITVMCCRD
jgi:hypothetical protein